MGENDNGNKMHWCKWIELCKPKKMGGLDFRIISLFNKAFLATHIWRIIVESESLVARLFKAQYFKCMDIMMRKSVQMPHTFEDFCAGVEI